MLLSPATPEVFSAVMAQAEAAPEELTTITSVMKAPPMPFIPAEYHGKLVSMAMMVYTGDLEVGQRAVAPFRALATPIADMIRPMHYPEMYPPEQAGYHPVAASRTMFIDTIDQHTLDVIFENVPASSAQMAVIQLRVLGGAMARIPNDATAFAHRHRRLIVNIAALYGNLAEAAQHEAWVGNFAAALPPSGFRPLLHV